MSEGPALDEGIIQQLQSDRTDTTSARCNDDSANDSDAADCLGVSEMPAEGERIRCARRVAHRVRRGRSSLRHQ